MAMKLAFYQLDGNDGGQPASARDWHTAANDPMADRPGIPGTVINWPAQMSGLNGASEDSARVHATPLNRPIAFPAALLEAIVLAALFVGLVVTVLLRAGPVLDRALSTEPAKPAARRVATVETRILSLEPAGEPAALASRTVE